MLLARVERIDKSNEIIGAGDDHGAAPLSFALIGAEPDVLAT